MTEGTNAAPTTGEQLRNQIRERIFASENAKPRTKTLEFFGTTIELRTPAVGSFLGTVSNDDKDDNQIRLIKLIIGNAYVPGSDTRVFTDGDYDSLVAMPFNNDMANAVKTINELTGVDLKAKEKN